MHFDQSFTITIIIFIIIIIIIIIIIVIIRSVQRMDALKVSPIGCKA